MKVDCGPIRQYQWIGNSERGIVLGIYSVIVMGYWWAISLFVKLISHILFCMYMCSKIHVPLGNCWLCVNPGFHSNVYVVWDVGTKSFRVFYVGFREDVYVEGSPLVSHIENNLKWPEVFMKMRSKWSNLERLVILDYTILWSITLVVKISLSDLTHLIKVNVASCMLVNWVLIWYLGLPCMCHKFFVTNLSNTIYLHLEKGYLLACTLCIFKK